MAVIFALSHRLRQKLKSPVINVAHGENSVNYMCGVEINVVTEEKYWPHILVDDLDF